ncbi:MAG: endonuclease/exonuclease/phosphatase family protein [Acidimicrobiia bacterium]|nr:endonuclease/exonuclease/phosphatase family protein [Acidimicrobiia bacterium]
MKLASFNVENLFARPKVFRRGDWESGRATLETYARISGLLEQAAYSADDKVAIAAGLAELELNDFDEGPFVLLRQNRGKLARRTGTGREITADGRGDWVGWLELRTELANEQCVANTARVVSELGPDVIAVIEADNRPALKRFSRDFVAKAPGAGRAFRHVMLIDGNDERGIDVGLMTRSAYRITDMRSHVDDFDDDGPVFSRDCAEFVMRTPGENDVLLLVNHFKSRGHSAGTDDEEGVAKRTRQATRAAEIYEDRVGAFPFVAVVGDLNDHPASASLVPLVDGTNLRDISAHAAFDDDGIPGTYGGASADNKIDYVLLSPALFDRVEGGGVFRAGVWDWADPPRWERFATMDGPGDAASDHAAIWADLDV